MSSSYFQDRTGRRMVPLRAVGVSESLPPYERRRKLNDSLDWILSRIRDRSRLMPYESRLRDRQLDDLYRRADEVVRLILDLV